MRDVFGGPSAGSTARSLNVVGPGDRRDSTKMKGSSFLEQFIWVLYEYVKVDT